MISLTMSREDWRTGSIPELPLLRKQKYYLKERRKMNKYDFVVYYKKFGKKRPVLSITGSIHEGIFLDNESLNLIKKVYPELKSKLYIDIIGYGTYVLQTKGLCYNRTRNLTQNRD